MTFEEMLSCSPFKLILGSYAAPKTPEAKEHLSNYLQLMHRALAGMNLPTFEKVCDQVIKTMARGQKPMPEDFLNAQRALYDSYRTNPRKEEHRCESCSGTGWIYVNMLSTEGEIREHCKPCPLCRRGHPLMDAPGKRDWVETEHSPFKLEATEKAVAIWKRLFENELDWSKSPQELMNELTALWKAGQLKVRKKQNNAIASLFERLKPRLPEPQGEQAAPLPAVDHVSPPQGTASTPPMVPAASTVVVNGQEYEIEE